MSDGPSHPPQLRRILREFAAISPDGTPRMAPLNELQHSVRKGYEFEAIVVMQPARPAQRIAFEHAVFRVRHGRTRRSISLGFGRIEQLLSIGRQGRSGRGWYLVPGQVLR